VIERRAFLGSLGLGLLLALSASEAQQAGKVARIGYLGFGFPARVSGLVDAFREGLRERGWIEGRDFTIEFRWAEGKAERLEGLAAELVQLKVDVIVAGAELPAKVAKKVTTTIPIVMTTSEDPVGSGLVESLARPGGNVTGSTLMVLDLAAKRLELLKELVPGVSRIGVLWNANDPAKQREFRETQAAARALGLVLHSAEIRGPDPDLGRAFSAIVRERSGALVIMGDTLVFSYRVEIAALAAKHRVPAMWATREFVQSGGLIAYGPSASDLFRRAAAYVDKILKGAKPADLPVEQPTKFELVINLKTAKTLGLTIPPSLLARADQIIE
jgi:putative ABC transport system substrate-binding protein